jgi:hypothetical protein
MIVGGPCEKTTCSEPPVKDKRSRAWGGGAGGGGGGYWIKTIDLSMHFSAADMSTFLSTKHQTIKSSMNLGQKYKVGCASTPFLHFFTKVLFPMGKNTLLSKICANIPKLQLFTCALVI